ncbi:MAG: PilZ domain-containing protein [Deltaproteobacteria bacterium]|nr:PilZ domain-containing protein [Deltaproteobacteria bacterium]
MKVLKTRFRTTDEFLEAYKSDLPAGGLFCPTTTSLDERDQVLVELNFPDLPNKMMLRGNVLWWRPALPRLRVRAGALVAFDEQEADKLAFIVGVAQGTRTGVKRRHSRVPIEHPARYRCTQESEFRTTALREISIGGAQLVTEERLDIDDDVTVELTPPGGTHPITLTTKVTYRTPTGYGLRFVYRDGGGSRRLRELVRRLVEA